VPESSNWCGYSSSSYSPSAAPLGGAAYAAYPDSTGPAATMAMDTPSASEYKNIE